jgi:hypothetical protein
MASYGDRQRQQMANRGQAMEGGRFPIKSQADLDDAIRAVGRVRPNTEEARSQVRRYIIRRAQALGLSRSIPDTWAADGSLKS